MSLSLLPCVVYVCVGAQKQARTHEHHSPHQHTTHPHYTHNLHTGLNIEVEEGGVPVIVKRTVAHQVIIHTCTYSCTKQHARIHRCTYNAHAHTLTLLATPRHPPTLTPTPTPHPQDLSAPSANSGLTYTQQQLLAMPTYTPRFFLSIYLSIY